jgi:alkaline phosphatase D
MVTKALSSLCCLLIGFNACVVDAKDEVIALSSGPMQGYTTMRSTTIWLQTKVGATSAQIEYWSEDKPEQHFRSKKIALNDMDDYTAHITLSESLSPSQKYAYRILIDDQVMDGVYHFATHSLWQWRTDPPESKVLLGSCAYINQAEYDRPQTPYGSGMEIFSTMAKAKPDLTLWLGDHVYFREADYSPFGMNDRYRHDRSTPYLQPLLQTGAHAAIWDDHDYGPNDANASFIHKDYSLEIFKRYWANPSYGLPEMPGVSTIVQQDDVEFFLLDGRYYRDDDKLTDVDKAMFGKQQLRWLKNALRNSNASYKFIVSGSQMLDKYSPYEGWRNFSQERDSFIDWLTQSGIEGVMFISGDRHHTELLQWTRDKAYPLYELTCSALTAGTHDITKEKNNPGIVDGTLVGEHNFCSLEFSGPKKERQMIMKSIATDGRVLWTKSFNVKDLTYPKK